MTDQFPEHSGLIPFGWNAAVGVLFDALDEPLTAAGALGRVGRVDRGECDVFTSEGTLRAASDSQRAQNALAPATGDWAVVMDDPDIGQVIEAILPRRTSIVRRDPSEQVIEQVLVANVDVVGITHGLDQEVNPARLERFLVMAWDSGATPVIVLTKADLATDVDAAVEQASLSDDVPVIVTSAETGEGMDAVRDLIRDGGSMVLLGLSGAGKSRLVNALIGDEVQAVGAVREADKRGRHTTTTRDLLLIPSGGIVIDTPGIRAVGVWAADVALDRVFGDIAIAAENCKFRDCTHRSEPRCAVNAAIDAGELDPARVDRYLVLWNEIASQSREAEERERKQNQGRGRRRRR